MIGHVFPAFFQFKGGKAVAVSVGIFAIVDWRCISVALAVFVIILLITRIISISSLLATASMPVCVYLFPRNTGEKVWISVLLTLAMALIIYLKHIENIKRLILGQEKPIFGKSKKD